MRLQILVVLMAFAEVGGVFAIGPFMALVADMSMLQDGGIAQVVIAGHSLGGRLASNFAHLYPEKATHLIMVNPIALNDSASGRAWSQPISGSPRATEPGDYALSGRWQLNTVSNLVIENKSKKSPSALLPSRRQLTSMFSN